MRQPQVAGAAAAPASAAAAASVGGERGPAEVGHDLTVGPTSQSRRGPAQSRPSEGEERFEFFLTSIIHLIIHICIQLFNNICIQFFSYLYMSYVFNSLYAYI